jgi:hypothetical protein
MTNNSPIIECKGKLMTATQFRSSNKTKGGTTPPFVFFYHVGDVLEICLDGKTYGNDGRFCRRSAAYNAELRHVIDKGSLHLFIVAIRNIEKNQEIVLPPDSHDSTDALSPLPSINADLREIKKPTNGLLISSSPEEAPLVSRDSNITKKKKKKVKVVLKPASTTTKKTPRKSTKIKAEAAAAVVAAAATAAAAEAAEAAAAAAVIVKQEINNDDTTENIKVEMIKDEPQPVNGRVVKKEEEEEKEELAANDDNDDYELKPPVSPSKNNGPHQPAKSSPAKLGLPDASGLIVGVNTINYDASSSLRNKAMSREERKMEMIMKAIEAMEKSEQRKKDGGSGTNSTTTGGSEKPPNKRRRSSSSYRNDSNLDVSSADESKPEPKRNRKKGRKSGPGTPQRRRSRVMSGGSASNMSADETMTGSTDSNTPSHNGPFRFPKTKKSMMSEWLQESESNNLALAEDDDVSANYLKGSRSPPGIATHLLRSTAQSPVKNVCSAKKRWLRQAISEDHTEEVLTNGSASPGGVEAMMTTMDMVTPLKKRRLANYKEDQEQEQEELDQAADNTNNKVPNGLKKTFLQNLVLEAVLDKAMEDMLATPGPPPTIQPLQAAAAETASNNTNSTEAAVVTQEQKVKSESTATSESLSSEAAIKAPEPNSAFKSFFTSNVSLEALEAEIAATRKQRVTGPAAMMSSPEPMMSSPEPEYHHYHPTIPKIEAVKMEDDDDKSTTTMTGNNPGELKQLLEVVANNQVEDDAGEVFVNKPETEEEQQHVMSPNVEQPVIPQLASPSILFEAAEKTSEAMVVLPQPAFEAAPLAAAEVKPKKKRVSLADYKSLRRGTSTTPATPSTPPSSSSSSSLITSLAVLTSHPITTTLEQPPQQSIAASLDLDVLSNHQRKSSEDQEEPGTPTQDEQVATVSAPPMLNTLPLFEKLDKLEQAQQEIKKNGKHTHFFRENVTASITGPYCHLTNFLKNVFSFFFKLPIRLEDLKPQQPQQQPRAAYPSSLSSPNEKT